MKSKVIIGFIGDHGVGKTTAANILKKRGFHKVSISNKVEEFATHLFSREEIGRNRVSILNQVRRRGCKVHKEYWLNLVLSTLPDDKNLIVFDDLSIDEAESKQIDTYQICRPNFSRIELPNMKTIVNNGSLRDFTSKIEELLKVTK